jgi:hypothetical protein
MLPVKSTVVNDSIDITCSHERCQMQHAAYSRALLLVLITVQCRGHGRGGANQLQTHEL